MAHLHVVVKSIADLVSLLLMSGEELSRFSEGVPVHTDDNLLLELRAPAFIYKDERAMLVRQLSPFFKIDTEISFCISRGFSSR